MSVISALAKTQISDIDCTIIQLTGLGMFFAFWSCKYLKVLQAEEGQTRALCLQNIRFFQDRRSLPHSHPDLEFADSVSITFEQQKREKKNNTVTQQESGDSVLCPVQLAAGIVQLVRDYPGTTDHTTISTYMTNGKTLQIMSEQVIITLRNAVGAIGKDSLGIAKDKISTHSICLGLAMAMYLGESPVYTIMLIGHWSSGAFLHYIRKQVMEFSHNVSRKMLSFQNYQHLPNFEHQIPENNTRQRNNPNNTKTRQNVGGDASRQV
jgi:hypothetical protein